MPILCFFKHVEWISSWSFGKVSPLNCSKTNAYLPEVLSLQRNNYHYLACFVQDLPDGTVVKNPCQCRWFKRHEFDPCVGRILDRGYGNPLQYSCLENSMDRFFCLRKIPYLSLVHEDWFLLQWAHFFCSENFAYITKVCPYSYYPSSI